MQTHAHLINYNASAQVHSLRIDSTDFQLHMKPIDANAFMKLSMESIDATATMQLPTQPIDNPAA